MSTPLPFVGTIMGVEIACIELCAVGRSFVRPLREQGVCNVTGHVGTALVKCRRVMLKPFIACDAGLVYSREEIAYLTVALKQ
ncbi:hypothetical protein [Variovorax jilinensis]|uniref:hypothetical protein n=1 Tax=Variovorax jilinensis TaxID=3053513 RepID=UPI0025778BA9|nr:hypothetical protein [Variovorax sp. J22P168]